VQKIVDPTGAGDAWRSGFLAGLEKGFDLQTCGQMGAVASAYAIEHYGTQEHFYTKEEFAKRYRQNFNTLLKL
jgi:adenosine kinase